jgi:hypothetical protein
MFGMPEVGSLVEASSKPWWRRDRAIPYAAADQLEHERLWNTGSPACAGDDTVNGLLENPKPTSWRVFFLIALTMTD